MTLPLKTHRNILVYKYFICEIKYINKMTVSKHLGFSKQSLRQRFDYRWSICDAILRSNIKGAERGRKGKSKST